jgi:hypothetical protein
MTPTAHTERYKNHRFPGDIISHGVWFYYRFHLSYRQSRYLNKRYYSFSDNVGSKLRRYRAGRFMLLSNYSERSPKKSAINASINSRVARSKSALRWPGAEAEAWVWVTSNSPRLDQKRSPRLASCA